MGCGVVSKESLAHPKSRVSSRVWDCYVALGLLEVLKNKRRNSEPGEKDRDREKDSFPGELVVVRD